jgi:hypothetical protein
MARDVERIVGTIGDTQRTPRMSKDVEKRNGGC